MVRYVPRYLEINSEGRQLRTLTDIRNECQQQQQGQNNASQIGGTSSSIPLRSTENFTILRTCTVRNQQFRVESRIFSFKFKTPRSGQNFEDFLLEAFEGILNYARQRISSEHLMGIKLNVISEDLHRPIGLHFQKAYEITPQMLLDLLYSVAQSNSFFFFNYRCVRNDHYGFETSNRGR